MRRKGKQRKKPFVVLFLLTPQKKWAIFVILCFVRKTPYCFKSVAYRLGTHSALTLTCWVDGRTQKQKVLRNSHWETRLPDTEIQQVGSSPEPGVCKLGRRLLGEGRGQCWTSATYCCMLVPYHLPNAHVLKVWSPAGCH